MSHSSLRPGLARTSGASTSGVRLGAGVAALALFLTVGTAVAAEGRRVVTTGDLDLTTEAGRQALDQRVRRAAETACADAHDGQPLGASLAARAACVRAARVGAMPEVERVVRIAREGGAAVPQVAQRPSDAAK